MRRRSLLAALAAGLTGAAGCSARSQSDDRDAYDVPARSVGPGRFGRDGSAVGPGEPGSVFPPRNARRAVRSAVTADESRGDRGDRLVLSRALAGVDWVGITLSTAFVSPPTPAAPARIWAGVTNSGTGNRRLSFGPTPPFSGYRGAATAGADPYLVPADGRAVPTAEGAVRPGAFLPDGPEDGAWRVARSVPAPTETTTRTLQSGETVAGEYHLLVDEGTVPDRAVYDFGADPAGLTLGLGRWAPVAAARERSTFADPEDGGAGDAGDPSRHPGLPAGDRTAWYHREDRPVALVPDRERLTLPRDRTTFRLRNVSTRPLAAGRDDWGLYRPVDDGDAADAGGTDDADGRSDVDGTTTSPDGGDSTDRSNSNGADGTGGDGRTWRLVAGPSTGRSDGGTGEATFPRRLPVAGQRSLSLAVGDAAAPVDHPEDADVTVAADLDPGTYALRFGAAATDLLSGTVTVYGSGDTFALAPPDPDPEDGRFDDRESVAYAALFRVADPD